MSEHAVRDEDHPPLAQLRREQAVLAHVREQVRLERASRNSDSACSPFGDGRSPSRCVSSGSRGRTLGPVRGPDPGPVHAGAPQDAVCGASGHPGHRPDAVGPQRRSRRAAMSAASRSGLLRRGERCGRHGRSSSW